MLKSLKDSDVWRLLHGACLLGDLSVDWFAMSEFEFIGVEHRSSCLLLLMLIVSLSCLSGSDVEE